MVNEHRPYLPIAVLSLALILPAGVAVGAWPRGVPRRTLSGGLVLILAALALLTWRRNEVFATEARYWKDVLDKAPSARAHLNYGLGLMRDGDLTGALRHYQQSLELAPTWYYTHINLGIAYQHLDDVARAGQHYDLAVAGDRFSGQALLWRGEFRLAQRDFAAARDDFLRALPLSLQRYRVARGLAMAYAGLGWPDSSATHVDRMRSLDPAAAERDVPPILTAIATSRPAPRAAAPQDTALMRQGLELLRVGTAEDAARVFQRVLAANPTHYGATYQLAVALDLSGRRDQARDVWLTVLGMATQYRDTAVMRRARDRLR
jgi:tetratricopeptide (TPR) repeat protein